MSQSSLDRRALLTGLAASAAWPVPGNAQDETIAFVAVGDWGRRGKRSQRQVAGAMGAAARDLASRFVLAAGDNFYPAGVGSVDDPHWRESFEDVYDAPALQTPWYAALGNHDYRGVAQAQIDYTALSHRWRMPSRYFRIGGETLGSSLLDLFVRHVHILLIIYLRRSLDEALRHCCHVTDSYSCESQLCR